VPVASTPVSTLAGAPAPAPVIAPPAPITAPEDDAADWMVAKASKKQAKEKHPIILSRNKKPAQQAQPQPAVKPKTSPPKPSPPKPIASPISAPIRAPVTSSMTTALSPDVLWGDIETEPVSAKKTPHHTRKRSEENPKEGVVSPAPPPKVKTPSPVTQPSPPPPASESLAPAVNQDPMLLSTSTSAFLEACVHDMVQ
jgi:hypothetical protein